MLFRFRKGLTLIEVLIATTLTLLLMLALAQGFKTLSDGVTQGRSKIHLSDQLRGIMLLLKSDLSSMTTDASSPQSHLEGPGYFKYFDGGLTDLTAILANRVSVGDVSAVTPVDPNDPNSWSETVKDLVVTSSSKWGDIDDILMFTAKAKSGESFRGKIPRAFLKFHEINNALQNSLPPPYSVNDADWEEEVTISSEFAEIVWFMIPLQQLDTGVVVPSNITIADVIGPDGMPRRIGLCRRVLLIRPDLNIVPPPSFRPLNVSNSEFYVRPPNINNSSNNPAISTPFVPSNYRAILQNAYKRCDLSVTVQAINSDQDQASSPPQMLVYKTNSLSDLTDPINRFAHGAYPIPTNGTHTAGTTLPLLFLSNGLEASRNATNIVRQFHGVGQDTDPLYDQGFIPESFMRSRYRRTDPTDPSTRQLEPTLEELVASNIVSFDIRAFDSTVAQLFHPGADGNWGAANFDDNGDNTDDNAPEAAWRGTDDLTVSPTDPGYWALMARNNGAFVLEASRGAYVDLGWGFKGLGLPVMSSFIQSSTVRSPTVVEFLTSDFSGTSAFGASRFLAFGGDFAFTPNSVFVYQNSYDTWTTQYEADGEQDGLGPSHRAMTSYRVHPRGLSRLGAIVPSITQDPLVSDVPPPYPSKLTSIQATIRVEDTTASNLQQLSLIHGLVK